MSIHLSELELMTALKERVQKIINRDKQKRLYGGVHLGAVE